MSNFFENDEGENTSAQDGFAEAQSADSPQEEIEESGHQEEGEEYASTEEDAEEYQDEEQGEDADTAQQLRLKDEEIEKYKQWTRAIQSSYDKDRADFQRTVAEMQGQIRQFMESQQYSANKGEEESYLDEYGEEKPLTASEVRRLMAAEEKKRLSVQEQEKIEQEKSRNEFELRAQSFYESQPDYEAVFEYYKNNLENNPKEYEAISRMNSPQARFYYVKNRMLEKKTLPKKNQNRKQKKRITPTGNPNRNFSSRQSMSANDMMQVLESKRKEYGRKPGFF